MDQPPVQSVERTLAILLFNAGLDSSRNGRHDEAVAALVSAAHLDQTDLCIAVVACKACFAVGRFDDAESYLERAKANGFREDQALCMTRAIRRAVAVQVSDQVPMRCEPNPMEQPSASWKLAFCDWLECVVHEFCQDLREAVARK